MQPKPKARTCLWFESERANAGEFDGDPAGRVRDPFCNDWITATRIRHVPGYPIVAAFRAVFSE